MSDKNSHQISLLNFDPKSSKEPIINSPRSLEALRRQGINPQELLIRTAAEIREMFRSKNLSKEGVDQMVMHYEERRREKVRVLLEERSVLIEDEKNGYLNFSAPKDKKEQPMKLTQSAIQELLTKKTDSTLIEKEKKQLERIKQRQEKEIKQLIDYENKMGDILKKQEEKEMLQREKERLKEMENARKRRENEERKRLEELEKQRKMLEEERVQAELAAEGQRRQAEAKARELEKERKRQNDIKLREEEQRKKHEEFARKTEAQALQKQNEILQRKEEIERKDRERQELLHLQWKRKQEEAEEKSRQAQEKLKQAKEKNDELLVKKKNDFDWKQSKNEEKKKLFEYERQKKMEETKRLAEQHAQMIQKVLEDNAQLQEEKKEKFKIKKALAEERKKELDLLAEAELKKQMEEDREKEEARKQVKLTMEGMLKEKTDRYLMLMDEKDMKVTRTKQARDEQLQKKHDLDVINRNDRSENVQRQAKMDDYKKQKLMEKIHDAAERGEKIKQDKAALLEMRQIIKREMQANKQSILDRFDKLKKGKLDTGDMEPERAYRTQPHTTKNNTISHMRSATNVKPKAPESTERRGNSQDHLKSLEKIDKTERTERTTVEKLSTSRPAVQQPLQSQQFFEQGMKNLTEKEARKALDELKMKQNQEMLRLLEEEHNRENQREARLKDITDLAERKKYEKSMAADRGKSHSRVQQLSEAHQSMVRQFMSKYNMKAIG